MVELWAALASWASPTAVFILLNVVVAVTSIFASRSHAQPDHHHHHQEPTARLLRAPSLLSRVSSFNFSNLNHSHLSAASDSPPATSSVINGAAQSSNEPIAHAPSLLSRLNSFNRFSVHRTTDQQQDQPPSASSAFNDAELPETEPIARAPSLLSRLNSFNRFSLHRSTDQPEDQSTPDELPETEPISRAPCLLSRITSFKGLSLNRSTAADSTPLESDLAPAAASELTRANTEPRKRKVPADESKMRKSASEKARETASFREEEVDAKADDFINRFKQQLRLQRIDSLLRHRNSAQ